jgi:uncharacterized protein
MKPGEIQQVLSQTNKWWSDEVWEQNDPDLRRAADAPFVYQPNILGDIVPGGLYILRGPRRAGKTVEIKRTISRLVDQGVDRRRIVHCACDGWRANWLGGLVSSAQQLVTGDGPRYWFLDEITGVSGDWPSQIKWLRDNTSLGEDCVVLTGSSSRDLDEALGKLAGRRGGVAHPDRILLPMPFASVCQAIGLDLPEPGLVRARDLLRPGIDDRVREFAPLLHRLVSAWELYLTIGGFPRAVEDQIRHGRVQPDFIEAIWRVIHDDALQGSRFTPAQTQGLLAELAGSMASPVNRSRIARDLGVANHTVEARLNDLALTYLAWPCYPERNGMPHLRAQPKVYFSDPLIARLAHLRNPEVKAPDPTVVTEQQIGVALLRQREHEAPGSLPDFDSVMFSSHRTGEVDFVGGWMGDVAIEAKYVDGGWRSQSRSLLATRPGGIVATRSEIDLSGNFKAIPAAILALLIEPRLPPKRSTVG